MTVENRASLIYIKAVRSGTGVKVQIKSKALESFFKQASGGVTTESYVDGSRAESRVKAYRNNEALRATISAINRSTGRNDRFGYLESPFFSDGVANLSVLRTVGIGDGDGVTFNFIGMYLNSDIEKWVSGARTFAEASYKAFAKNTEYVSETFISSKVVEPVAVVA